MPFDNDISETFDANYLSLVNRFSLFTVETGLFPSENHRATHSTASQSRSESAIAINPKNSSNMIGCSKKFIDPAIYHFKLGPIYTFDSGITWHEAQLPMHQDWDGMADPTVAFDSLGNAFLVGGPVRLNRAALHSDHDLTGLGMVVYRSRDGGRTWENPTILATDSDADKQWVICDNHPYSPYYGNVYAVWGAHSPLMFARSTDHGNTWRGKGNELASSTLVSYSFSPETSVSSDGTLHILWHNDGSSTINYLCSRDGGNTFEPVKTVVSGIHSLRSNLPITGDWPHFDHGKFRVITLVTDCTSSSNILIVAWADMREGRSRIYYRRSRNKGVTWEGPESGQALLPNVSYGDSHCFHPQIIATKSGVIGCAFYTFAKEFNHYLIKVQLAASWDDGKTFSQLITVTEQSWDPLINAPAAHGNPDVHFIGEYFGLDADDEDFALLWTDTRTGVQELFSDIVRTKKLNRRRLPELVGEVFGGVTRDGGGWIIIGGKVIKIPPRSPVIEVLNALVALDAISDGQPNEEVEELKNAALQSSVQSLQKAMKKILNTKG